MNKRTRKLTVYSRTWCHLCDAMLADLRTLQVSIPLEIEIIDVDTDPLLESRYGDDVPVLAENGQEICRHHLDLRKLDDYLRKIG